MDLESQLSRLFNHETCSFYRDHWGKLSDYENLPPVNSQHLVNASWLSRNYNDGSGIVRLVERDNSNFLLKKTYKNSSIIDLFAEPQFVLVMHSNPDDALEMGLTAYEAGSVPFIGDIKNLSATAISCEQFGIRTMIADLSSIASLYKEVGFIPSVNKAVVLSEDFTDLSVLNELRKKCEVTAQLYIPEAGLLGEVNINTMRIEKSRPDVILEPAKGSVSVTKLDLAFPLIRYEFVSRMVS